MCYFVKDGATEEVDFWLTVRHNTICVYARHRIVVYGEGCLLQVKYNAAHCQRRFPISLSIFLELRMIIQRAHTTVHILITG